MMTLNYIAKEPKLITIAGKLKYIKLFACKHYPTLMTVNVYSANFKVPPYFPNSKENKKLIKQNSNSS